MGIYSESRRLHEREELMYKDVAVDISLSDRAWLVDAPGKVSVPFDLDFEYRSWGLKGIEIILQGNIIVSYTAVNQDTDESQDKEVEVELLDLPIEWAGSNYYGPDSLYLAIKPDGAVDYTRSHITVCYIKK